MNSAPIIEAVNQERYKKQFFKTSICKYYLEGTCKKGEQCSHAHHEKELQEKPVLSKTRMCKQVLRNGNCNDPECTFAHGIDELVSANAFFRTKMCEFHLNGGCKLGDKCRYAHSPDQLNENQCVSASPASSYAQSMKSVPSVDFNDSPDTGYPLRKRGSVSSRSTMASGSYASFSNFAQFQVPAVVFVYPTTATYPMHHQVYHD